MYQYTLQGTDLQELYKWAETMEKNMAKLPGFLDVTTDLQLKSLELRVRVDQEKAASLGVTYDDVRKVLYAAYGTQQAATLYTQSNDFQVILEAAPESQRSPDDIKTLYVRSKDGRLVPLDTFVTVTQGLGGLTVNHQGQLPAVTVSFNLAPGVALEPAKCVLCGICVRTAERLGRTQPAVTLQLRRLEETFGARLLARDRRCGAAAHS
jgi:HAE1 family hydrophobic/amphiphilic exporter-1